MTLLILSLALALGVSALCSLFEATLLSLPSSQVLAMRNRYPRAAALWELFKSNIDKPIAAILVVNTAAHTIGASMAGAQFEILYGEKWLLAFSLVFTYFMLQFTEILPKTLGVHYNRWLAPRIAHPLNGLTQMLTPILRLVRFVNRPFEGRRMETDTTLEDISSLASMARLSRIIDARQERMIHAASRLGDVMIRQIMTPRVDVVSLRLDQSIEDLFETVRNSPYARLPLCENDIDQIVGLVHVRDLFKQLDLRILRFEVTETPTGERQYRETDAVVAGSARHVLGSGDIDLAKISRDILFLPDRLPVIRALRQFQESRTHLAAVVNEYGATVGIVTLEDVLEEMVGEIEDEFDLPASPLLSREKEGYRVSGRMQLHDLATHLPEAAVDDADVDTVSGYVAKLLGRIPKVGDELNWGPYRAKVTRADSRRLQEVLLIPSQTTPENRNSQINRWRRC